MPPDQALRTVLDERPESVRIWWRDDDAGRMHPRLERLLALARSHSVDLALAVVPAWLQTEARDSILDYPLACVLQHGCAHENHAQPGGKKVEIGGSLAPSDLRDRLHAGYRTLQINFGPRFLPVLAPPWNRIDAAALASLPDLGFIGLSRFGRPAHPNPAPRLLEINTQVDIVLWREQRRAMRVNEIAVALAAAIRLSAGEPVGILSHHLEMDDEAFAGLDHILSVLQDHSQARLVGAPTLFREAG
jgi:hypothetical protein